MGPGFLTPLVAMKVAEASDFGRALWLIKRLVFHSAIVGRVEIEDFESDFSSVPRWPLMFTLAGDTAHASAVVHDYLCRVWVPQGRTTWREAADVFAEAMKCEGVPAWRRTLMHWAVMGADPANKWEEPT